MGFFAQHGSYSEGTGRKFSVAESGVYICSLIDIEAVQGKSFDDPTVLEPNYKFVFETTEVGDEDGQPFRFVQFTKTVYGNEKAKLTILLDSMLGKHLDRNQYAALDINSLKSQKWQVVVGTRQKLNGEYTNMIETVKPVKQTATKPLKKVQEDITDPFEDA
jgi:hypothetical protein